MKREMTTLLSGLGYYKLSEQRRKTLAMVFAGSVILHLIALLAFGSWVVIQHLQQEETVFVAPPPMKTYQPKQLEHKVKVQKRQRSSSRPTLTPRMVANRPSNFALPEIETDSKVVKTAFQPDFKPVTGVGMGMGTGLGFGMSGFGTGVSEFDFFGIRGRGDKFAILVDVSVSMVAENIGGRDSFDGVRNRIGQVVNQLNRGALFNVIAFADAASAFQKEMVIASDENKREAVDFLKPFNRGDNLGLDSGNLNPASSGVPALGGETRLDLALTSAFEQGADTILVISDGLPRVIKSRTSSGGGEREAWMRRHGAEYRKQMAEYRAAMKNVQYRTETVNQPVRKDGVRIGTRKVTRRVPINPPPKPRGPPGGGSRVTYWTFSDFVKHFSLLHEEHYEKKGRRLPVVHIIGYSIGDKGREFLRDFAREYEGKYRSIGKRRD